MWAEFRGIESKYSNCSYISAGPVSTDVMLPTPGRPERRQVATVLVVGLLASAGTATALAILTVDPNPITPAEGSLSSSPVTVDSQSLTYSGTNATGVDVVVNNTDTADHTVDVHLALRTADGTLLESTTVSGQTVTTGATATVTWTFASSHSVDTFSTVEVTVEQTG